MKILLGTTNDAKVNSFKKKLHDFEVEFITLNDINIKEEPAEVGNNPLENAKIKANFYGKYYDYVICNDSGLYFENLPLDDARQPGLNVRNVLGKRLNDDEMIEHYSNMANGFGGEMIAYYLNGFAVYNKGEVSGFMEHGEINKANSFIICNQPHAKRVEGWPIDSLSKHIKTKKYYFDLDDSKYSLEDDLLFAAYEERLKDFFMKAFHLTRKK